MRRKKMVKGNKMVVFNQENYDFLIKDLREARLSEGISQEQMALDCGVTRQSIYNFESGKNYSMALVVQYLIKFYEPLFGKEQCFDILMNNVFNTIDYKAFGYWFEGDEE